MEEQIINAEESLASEGMEFSESEGQEQKEERQSGETKRVSDRINEIRRQEAEKRQSLEQELAQLKEYKREQELVAEAREKGIEVDELRADREAEERRLADAIKNDPHYKELELKVFEQTVANDLAALQKEFPEDNIKDIRSLDERFGMLRDNGIDAVTAYRAIRTQQTIPPTTGSSKSFEGEKSGYTLEDIKNMSPRQIADNYEEVMKAYKQLVIRN